LLEGKKHRVAFSPAEAEFFCRTFPAQLVGQKGKMYYILVVGMPIYNLLILHIY